MTENRPEGSAAEIGADETTQSPRRRRSKRPAADPREAETAAGAIAAPELPPAAHDGERAARRSRKTSAGTQPAPDAGPRRRPSRTPARAEPLAAEARPTQLELPSPDATEAEAPKAAPPKAEPRREVAVAPFVPSAASSTPRPPGPREIEVAPFVPSGRSPKNERPLRERHAERERTPEGRERDGRERDGRERDGRERNERPPASPGPDTRFKSGPRPRLVQRAFPPENIDEDAVRVIRRLTSAGHHAYLVGGGVRDLLLGRRPKDFDVATSARPHEVKALFRNCRIIGRRFRLAHILFGGRKVIETATFRRDPTEGEPIEVETTASGEMDALSPDEPEFTTLAPRPKSRDEDADLLIRHDNVFGEPHEDAIRRDFTINGLFYDLERREVIDYVGGLSDLESRVVRTIGLPDVRFREDPVRILRAIKFAARCDLGIDPDVYDAICAQREELRRAAPARLYEEILRLLRGGAAQRSFWLAWETGVLSVVLPELASFLDDDALGAEHTWGRLHALDTWIARHGCPPDTTLVSALVLGPIEEAMEGSAEPHAEFQLVMDSIAESLVVPRKTRDRMRVLSLAQSRLKSGRIGSLARREFFPEAALLHELDARGRGRTPTVTAAEAETSLRETGVSVETNEPSSPGERFAGGGGGGRRRRRRRRG